MKKLCLSMLSSALIIVTANANPSINTGFLAGISTGSASTSGNISGDNTAVYPNPYPGSSSIGAKAFGIGLHVAYGVVTNGMYYGAELGYALENTKISLSSRTGGTRGSLHLKRNSYFKAAARTGCLIRPDTMIYAKLGFNVGKWSLTDSLLHGFNNNHVASRSKRAVSVVPGLGVETALQNDVYLRIEYTYELCPSFNAKSLDQGYQTRLTKVSSLNSQSGKIGLSYKF